MFDHDYELEKYYHPENFERFTEDFDIFDLDLKAIKRHNKKINALNKRNERKFNIRGNLK